MWKKLYVVEHMPDLYISINKELNGYQILVTDYLCIFSNYFSSEEFYSKIKECNEDLEFERNEEFVEKAIIMLTNPKEVKKIEIERETNDILSICMRTSFGYPFCFDFKVYSQSRFFFYEKITKPLLKTIKDLQTSQTKLRQALKRKDKVLKAYKDKGLAITAKRLKNDLVEFCDETHMNDHKEFESVFENNADLELVLTKSEKPSDIPTTNEIVKMEPGTIKTEPETPVNDVASIPSTGTVKTEPETLVSDVASIPSSGTIKKDPETSVNDEASILSSVSREIKQEHVKIEPTKNIPRKRQRKKFNI